MKILKYMYLEVPHLSTQTSLHSSAALVQTKPHLNLHTAVERVAEVASVRAQTSVGYKEQEQSLFLLNVKKLRIKDV